MDSKIFEQNAHGDRIFLVDCPRRTHKGLGQMINYHLELDNDLIADGIINYFSDTLCWKSHRSALKKNKKKNTLTLTAPITQSHGVSLQNSNHSNCAHSANPGFFKWLI